MKITEWIQLTRLQRMCTSRAVARALIGGGGGGVYSYIRVMTNQYLLKSIVIRVNFKRN